VDTEGLVLQARFHSAKVPDADGIRPLLEKMREHLPRLLHLWVDAGYQRRGRRWAEEVLGVSVEVVRKPKKLVPEEVAKEGKEVDWQRLMREVSKYCRGDGLWKVFLLALSEQEDEQGLRASTAELGGFHLRRDDAFDGEEASPWVGPLG
jgi:Transposase DDE domain